MELLLPFAPFGDDDDDDYGNDESVSLDDDTDFDEDYEPGKDDDNEGIVPDDDSDTY